MHKLRCLLINPPIKLNSPPYNIPLGLACIAAIIEEKGHDVAIFDNNAYRLPCSDIIDEIRGEEWDIISIGSLVTTYSWQKEMFTLLKQHFPDALLVAGGGLATSIQAELMEWIPEIDVLVVGEGERTIAQILEKFHEGKWEEVQGIYYRNKGVITNTPPQRLLSEEELSRLPYPKIDLLPLDVYFGYSNIPLSPESLAAKRRLSIETSRGCPFTCSFCIDLPSGTPRNLQYSDPDALYLHSMSEKRKIRYYSIEWVIGLIRELRLKYAIDFLTFTDETFTVNKNRVLSFCDAMEKAGLTELDPPLYFGTTAHVSTIDREMLARLKEVGCSYLDLGLESMNTRILTDDIAKKSTQEKNRWGVDELLGAGIYPVTNFMVGLPHETMQSIYDTTRFLVEYDIECGPFFVTPYPGTALFEQFRDAIIEEFGSLENYVIRCEDDVSMDFIVNLTRYNDAELLGIRQMLINHDLDAIRKFARDRKEILAE